MILSREKNFRERMLLSRIRAEGAYGGYLSIGKIRSSGKLTPDVFKYPAFLKSSIFHNPSNFDDLASGAGGDEHVPVILEGEKFALVSTHPDSNKQHIVRCGDYMVYLPTVIVERIQNLDNAEVFDFDEGKGEANISAVHARMLSLFSNAEMKWTIEYEGDNHFEIEGKPLANFFVDIPKDFRFKLYYDGSYTHARNFWAVENNEHEAWILLGLNDVLYVKDLPRLSFEFDPLEREFDIRGN